MITFDYNPGKRKAILSCDREILDMTRNHFSYPNEGAYFARKKGYRFVADRKYAITPTGMFDFGLYNEIEKFLISKQFTEIEYSEAFSQRRNVSRIDSEELWDGLKYSARYYQLDAVREALCNSCGTIIMATGAGKSLTQALLIENYYQKNPKDFKCLIIVPGLSLVNQLVGDFQEYGVSLSVSPWTGENELQDTQIIVCNSENLLAKFDDNPWIKDVDMVIQDECHKVKKSMSLGKDKKTNKKIITGKLTKCIQKIKTTSKFGFTGTLSEDKGDRWKTIGTFGPIIYEKKSKELRDEKYLSDLRVHMLELNHGKVKRMSYQKEIEYLYENDRRNDKICKLAQGLKGNVLIMVDRLEYGERLKSLISNSYFVNGEMPVEERKEILNKMESCDDIVCIAMSSIFSTGINVKNLPNIIFTYGGKSFIRIIQSVGRGLRLHENKNKLIIIDVCDNVRYSLRHAEERRRIYEKENIPFRVIQQDL